MPGVLAPTIEWYMAERARLIKESFFERAIGDAARLDAPFTKEGVDFAIDARNFAARGLELRAVACIMLVSTDPQAAPSQAARAPRRGVRTVGASAWSGWGATRAARRPGRT